MAHRLDPLLASLRFPSALPQAYEMDRGWFPLWPLEVWGDQSRQPEQIARGRR